MSTQIWKVTTKDNPKRSMPQGPRSDEDSYTFDIPAGHYLERVELEIIAPTDHGTAFIAQAPSANASGQNQKIRIGWMLSPPLGMVNYCVRAFARRQPIPDTVLRIIHISDLHIGAKLRDRVQSGRALVEAIGNKYGSLRSQVVIVVTGDITDSGLDYQFQNAKSIFSALSKYPNITVLMCPGNHDLHFLGNEIVDWNITRDQKLDSYGKILGQHTNFPTEHTINGCHFIGLNSISGDFTPAIADTEILSAQGAIGSQQLKELDRILGRIHAQEKNPKIVVYLHHHPIEQDYFHALLDAGKLLEVVAGRVNVMLFGHKHNAREWYGENRLYDIDIILESGESAEPAMRMQKRFIDHQDGSVEELWMPAADGSSVQRLQEIRITSVGPEPPTLIQFGIKND